MSSVIPEQMRAMVLTGPGNPLTLETVDVPRPATNELLIQVSACGICRTDLHVVDGELADPTLPLIPGHQIVGKIVAVADGMESDWLGRRVGVPWLGGSCGSCAFCQSQQENLCDQAVYTGYQRDGGFAEFTVADSRYCFPLPERFADDQAAPLLCAGLIGYRAYRRAGDSKRLGLYGFGAAAHILIQVAKSQQKTIFAFTRPGDAQAQQFALSLGADWVGDSSQSPPAALDAAIIFAPDGTLVPAALKAVRKGGRVVCAGIHMSDIPGFPYQDLWGERCICSVANLTRRDGEEFLPLAAAIPVKTEVHSYPLDQVNEALNDLRHGRFTGAAVVIP
jgi:propanol-preferring alcohol dehydrogenase